MDRLVPRSSHCPVLDCLQYELDSGIKGRGTKLGCMQIRAPVGHEDRRGEKGII